VDVDIQEVEQCAKELDRHYIPSRYPAILQADQKITILKK
jgi:HEPN domain-containing protein